MTNIMSKIFLLPIPLNQFWDKKKVHYFHKNFYKDINDYQYFLGKDRD